jgi:hypothetical protein
VNSDGAGVGPESIRAIDPAQELTNIDCPARRKIRKRLMSEDFMDRIRSAAAADKAKKERLAQARDEKNRQQIQHFSAFKAALMNIIEPALKKVQAELKTQGMSAEIVYDLRMESAAEANYNTIKLKFSSGTKMYSLPDVSEVIVQRCPDVSAISFKKRVSRLNSIEQVREVTIREVQVEDITEDIVLDLATAVVVEAFR